MIQSGLHRFRVGLPKYLLLLGITLQAGIYIALWLSYVTHVELLSRADFVSFYAVGRIADTVGFSHIYDLNLQHAIQQEVLGHSLNANDMLMFVHLPLLLPFQALVSGTDYTLSYIFWEILLLLFLGLSIYYSYRLFKDRIDERMALQLILIAECLFYPVFIGILKGQDTVFLLMGAMIWTYGLHTSNDRTAGLGLALMSIRPQLALMLAIPFFFNRRKVFWWFLAGATVLALYCALLVNTQGIAGLLNTIFTGAQQDSRGMSETTMFNLTGLLTRAMPAAASNMIHAISWSAYLVAIPGLSLLWAKSKQIDFRHISLAIVTGIFTSPHLHYHDLGLLILPILGIAFTMLDEKKWQGLQAAWLIAGISILMFVFDNSPSRFPFAYFLMAVLAVFLWIPRSEKSILHTI